MKESEVLDKGQEIINSGESVALCSIIEKRGSSPRGAGTKILVTQDGETYGTVGGGQFEKKVVNEAEEAIKNGKSETKTYGLNEEETGLWCGGETTVFFDVMGTAPEIVIVGSGNIAKPVYEISNTLGYSTTVLDKNESTLTNERFPEANRILDEYDKALEQVETNENTYVIVLQGDPHNDVKALKRFVGKVPYLGVIGSDAKVKRMKQELEKDDYLEQDIESIKAPIGVDIDCERPPEIAVSIMAEVVDEINK